MKFSIFLLATRYSQALSKIHKRCQNRMQGELGEIGTTLLWNGLSFFLSFRKLSAQMSSSWNSSLENDFAIDLGIFPNVVFFQILFPAKKRSAFSCAMFCYLVRLESGLSWFRNVFSIVNREE